MTDHSPNPDLDTLASIYLESASHLTMAVDLAAPNMSRKHLSRTVTSLALTIGLMADDYERRALKG